ncbi:hypothetical protein NIES4075_07530 [Tolypothrix sp. NIES-4075]|uniref:hypothetical protein n=1 Tax=Tolypothrix sp. NIES-4075 TaxID=2005459 RepID=UPI000B5C9F3E|nr:hypothetical protein [Tolypothrix sp. NIES-4075]GAX39794.1 hypothetical protein NIES4075_07530 [Tolypothrix sp. NIES-4075]
MNQHNSNNDDDVIITMIDNIEKFIEKPNPVFDNMPICPFVNKFRQENKIVYKVCNFYYYEKLGLDPKVLDLINEFKTDEYHEVMIVIHPNKQALSLEDMKQFTKNLNNLISALGLIAFSGHPLDDFNIDGVYTRRDPFINFTVQNIQKLNLYAEKLKSTGYYERWTLENLNYINHVI